MKVTIMHVSNYQITERAVSECIMLDINVSDKTYDIFNADGTGEQLRLPSGATITHIEVTEQK
jgi:hypothetical protein